MNIPENFTLCEGYAVCRLSGKANMQEGITRFADAIIYARESGVTKLLVDTTGLEGLGQPRLMDRYEMATRFAEVAGTSLKVVALAAPELIDPQKFGVVVARNRGLLSNVFTSEAEAIAWLLDANAS